MDPDTCATPEEVILALGDPNPVKRKKALRELCPCHVKRDIPEVWEMIIKMTEDKDPDVRYQALHNLCDGSPNTREEQIIEVLNRMHNDEDKKIRRKVHQILSSYRRTGEWNVM